MNAHRNFELIRGSENSNFSVEQVKRFPYIDNDRTMIQVKYGIDTRLQTKSVLSNQTRGESNNPPLIEATGKQSALSNKQLPAAITEKVDEKKSDSDEIADEIDEDYSDNYDEDDEDV